MRSPLRLTSKDAQILRRGHPWLYHAPRYGELARAEAGTVFECVDEHGEFLARGLSDPAPPIGLRILSRDPGASIDRAWFARRIAGALAHRERFLDLSGTTAYRWVNGEGDGLPGLVVDRYGEFAGLQVYTPAWHPWLDDVVAALCAAAPLAGIVTRDRVRRARKPGELGEFQVLHGDAPPADLVVAEYGVRFLASLEHGQKTGLYLDQRENRRAVGALAHGAEVLNCFSYTGGFGLHAALGGAARTTNVDVARKAQAAARRNYELNGLDAGAHRFPVEDVFKFLEREERRGHGYDLVVTDPPSFATSKKSVFNAAKGYRRLAEAACRVTRPGGVLVAASCTAQVSYEEFRRALQDGAAAAGAALRILERRGLPADHPVPVAFPEGQYLKFLTCVREEA